MCHDMCKCFGRVGENREGMEALRLSVSLREGSDDGKVLSSQLPEIFQSTLPRREQRCSMRNICCKSTHFNPRSREGSDTCMPEDIFQPKEISIHAPAKGATAKITKTIPNDFGKINNYNNSFA